MSQPFHLPQARPVPDWLRTTPQLRGRDLTIREMQINGPFRRAVMHGFNDLYCIGRILDFSFAHKVLSVFYAGIIHRITSFDGKVPNRAITEAVAAIRECARMIRRELQEKKLRCKKEQP